ncbi:transposase [Saccharothrix ecbatanensis]|uniref:Transposase n=1 Tax=Saccharothrix ecbatanensis TaxID=1105145 RepID=A0A7W9HIW8_9PSEU|nr:transposase [Saccharothrix ecbatanensis]
MRLVYNRALEARTAAWFGEQRRVNYEQTSALLTEWKKTDGLGSLNEVSSVPLQQSLRHLQTAFTAFWEKRSHWYGRDLVVVDRWLPSSKTCSACGHLMDTLPLRVREWTCPGCGASHDRDVNAARNILAAGRAATACGAGVRPTRH